MRIRKRFLVPLGLAVAAFAVSVSIAGASTPSFSNQTLFGTWDPTGSGLTIGPAFPGAGTPSNSSGDSEPAIAFADDGTMAVDGLGWLPFQVNVWTGTFGSTPSYIGGLDQVVPSHGNKVPFRLSATPRPHHRPPRRRDPQRYPPRLNNGGLERLNEPHSPD